MVNVMENSIQKEIATPTEEIKSLKPFRAGGLESGLKSVAQKPQKSAFRA
jgi:hypothetical protein